MRTKARASGQNGPSSQNAQKAQNSGAGQKTENPENPEPASKTEAVPKTETAPEAEAAPRTSSRQPAGIDELTGVWNRAGFIAAATPMFKSCVRREAPVALAYFDFYFNDNTVPVPGDPTVDRALVAMGDLMRKAFRASDIVGRIDPLRFAVLLPDCTDAALAAVDGVRALSDESSSQLKLAAGMVRNVAGGTLDDLMFAANARTKAVKRETH